MRKTVEKEEKMADLIAAVRSVPMLWDLQSSDYKDSHKKHLAWEGIADELHFEGS